MTNVPDWLAALAIVVPALTALGGYWLAGRNEEARDRRTATREAAARHLSRAERLEEKRHEFQLDLLLQLQDVLRRQIRATMQILIHDHQTLDDHGRITRLPAEINEESFAAGIDLGRLQARVLDDDLRREVDALHTFTSEISGTELAQLNAMPSEDAIRRIEALMADMGRRYSAVLETLGRLLRAELGRTTDIVPTGEDPASQSSRREQGDKSR